MNILKTIPFIAALLLCNTFVLASEQAPSPQEKPAFAASTSTMVTAKVAAINHETREVTLKQNDGSSIDFIASEEARNLDQVSVGDLVTAEYIESISIEVLASDDPQAAQLEVTAAARSEKGEMPGAVVVETQVEVATVEAINIEANTFKLKSADGSITEYNARNPENLKKSAVGDIVVTTYTQAMALSVKKAPAKK